MRLLVSGERDNSEQANSSFLEDFSSSDGENSSPGDVFPIVIGGVSVVIGGKEDGGGEQATVCLLLSRDGLRAGSIDGDLLECNT